MEKSNKTLQFKDFVSYDFRQLISTRVLSPFSESATQIICDIDKTYLDTKTDGAIQVLKIAFEDAKDKITLPGAAQFLMAARWDDPWSSKPMAEDFEPRALHFISASPPQLRRTIEQKLTEDGLDWNTDSFKNQAYNIRKGKLGLLRHHIAYKTATSLQLIHHSPQLKNLFLIGDSAEHDAFIYLNIALFLASKISPKSYFEILYASGVQKQVAEDLLTLMKTKPNASVKGIFIRNVKEAPFLGKKPLTESIIVFQDYFEACLVAIRLGMIKAEAITEIARLMHNHCDLSLTDILSQLSLALREYFEEGENDYKTIAEAHKLIAKIADPKKELKSDLPILPRKTIAEIEMDEKDIVAQAIDWAEQLSKR